MLITFGGMVKIQHLAQFPMDYLSHPLVSSLVLPQFASFANFVINRYVSFSLLHCFILLFEEIKFLS